MAAILGVVAFLGFIYIFLGFMAWTMLDMDAPSIGGVSDDDVAILGSVFWPLTLIVCACIIVYRVGGAIAFAGGRVGKVIVDLVEKRIAA